MYDFLNSIGADGFNASYCPVDSIRYNDRVQSDDTDRITFQVVLSKNSFVLQTIFCCTIQINDVGSIGYKLKYSILQYESYGLISCAQACKSISKCTSVNYDRSKLTCGINFVSNVSPDHFIYGEDFVFSWIKDWPKDCLDTVDIACPLCEQYVKLSSKKSVCMKVVKSSPWIDRARFKGTFQSSTYDAIFPSQNAVNGKITDTAITNFEQIPYWYVDLGADFYIKNVTIHTRWNCCGERFHDVKVQVGLTLDEMIVCGEFVGPGQTNTEYTINCTSVVIGQYVKLSIVKGEYNILELAEVNVYTSENPCM